jgi:hypothetical protein
VNWGNIYVAGVNREAAVDRKIAVPVKTQDLDPVKLFVEIQHDPVQLAPPDKFEAKLGGRIENHSGDWPLPVGADYESGAKLFLRWLFVK